jgi:hypothetical protein
MAERNVIASTGYPKCEHWEFKAPEGCEKANIVLPGPIPVIPPLNQHTIDEFYVCGGGSHKYVETELHEDCTVQVLECSECGHLSGAWWPGKKDDAPIIKNDLHI